MSTAAERGHLARMIATLIADYRHGEISPPSEQHVLRWVEQFDAAAQTTLLQELCRLLPGVYVSYQQLKTHLDQLLTLPDLVGQHPANGLRRAKFLDLQQAGTSQRTLLRLLEERLVERFGLCLDDCGTDPAHYVYLDDGVYTGRTFAQDLERWLPQAAPGTTIHVVLLGLHTEARDYRQRRLAPLLHRHKVRLVFWALHLFDNRRDQPDRVECLWPRQVLGDAAVDQYAAQVAERVGLNGWRWTFPLFRPPHVPVTEVLFSSPAARDIVEEQFLKAGVRIIQRARHANPQMRPLGFDMLESLGFGAMFISCLNIANSCPLALWYGLCDWHPLFRRKGHEDSRLAGSRPADSLNDVPF